jgi:hypothetical protein
MVNSAWRRRLEGWFLRQVFTIRQRMTAVSQFSIAREPQRSLTPQAAEAHAFAGARDLRIDSPGTFSSMRWL